MALIFGICSARKLELKITNTAKRAWTLGSPKRSAETRWPSMSAGCCSCWKLYAGPDADAAVTTTAKRAGEGIGN